MSVATFYAFDKVVGYFAKKYSEFWKRIDNRLFDTEKIDANIKFGLSTINGELNKSSTRGAKELIKGDNNFVTTKDPGFVDYKNGDYTLKADSEVFEKIPGFENIEMSKIGNNAPVGPVK